MARPGIMIYFDMLGPIRVLPDEDKGRLLVAMLEYGQSGTVPEFDGMLALAWEFVKPKIDKDDAEYNMSVLRRQYATACRDRKRKGESEITFDEWLKTNRNHDNQKPSMMIIDNQWYPTTTTSATPSTNTSTTITTAAAATTTETDELAAAADRKVKVLGGELGKNVVFLSDEQFDDLLDKMDLETFNHYVDKLSNFIIKNGAHVKNHYETLLKWWREDSVVHKHRSHKKEVPKGASGELGQAELEAIQRILAEAE